MRYIRPLPPFGSASQFENIFQPVDCEDIPAEWREYTKFKDQEDIYLEVLIHQAFDIPLRKKALPGEKC